MLVGRSSVELVLAPHGVYSRMNLPVDAAWLHNLEVDVILMILDFFYSTATHMEVAPSFSPSSMRCMPMGKIAEMWRANHVKSVT